MKAQWQDYHQRQIAGWITGSTIEKNYRYTKLMPIIDDYIDLISKGWYTSMTEDERQLIHITLFNYSLNRIPINRISTAKGLVFIACKNQVYGQLVARKYVRNQVFNRFYSLSSTNEEQEEQLELQAPLEQLEVDKQSIRLEILQAIDKKIQDNQQHKQLVLMLLLLKDWLISNNYDERGFGNYCLKVMRIQRSTFNTLFSRAGIPTTLFFKEVQLEPKKYKKIKTQEVNETN